MRDPIRCCFTSGVSLIPLLLLLCPSDTDAFHIPLRGIQKGTGNPSAVLSYPASASQQQHNARNPKVSALSISPTDVDADTMIYLSSTTMHTASSLAINGPESPVLSKLTALVHFVYDLTLGATTIGILNNVFLKDRWAQIEGVEKYDKLRNAKANPKDFAKLQDTISGFLKGKGKSSSSSSVAINGESILLPSPNTNTNDPSPSSYFAKSVFQYKEVSDAGLDYVQPLQKSVPVLRDQKQNSTTFIARRGMNNTEPDLDLDPNTSFNDDSVRMVGGSIKLPRLLPKPTFVAQGSPMPGLNSEEFFDKTVAIVRKQNTTVFIGHGYDSEDDNSDDIDEEEDHEHQVNDDDMTTMVLTSSQESEQVLKDSIPFFLEKDAVRKPDEIEPLLPSTSTRTTSDETFVHLDADDQVGTSSEDVTENKLVQEELKEIKSILNLDETISETIYNIVHENARDEEEILSAPTTLESAIETTVDLEVEEASDFPSDPVELDSDNDIVPSLINALDSEEVFLPIDEGDTPMVDDKSIKLEGTNLESEIQTNMKLEVDDIVTVMEVKVQDIETIEEFHASPVGGDSEKYIVASAIETDESEGEVLSMTEGDIPIVDDDITINSDKNDGQVEIAPSNEFTVLQPSNCTTAIMDITERSGVIATDIINKNIESEEEIANVYSLSSAISEGTTLNEFKPLELSEDEQNASHSNIIGPATFDGADGLNVPSEFYKEIEQKSSMNEDPDLPVNDVTAAAAEESNVENLLNIENADDTTLQVDDSGEDIGFWHQQDVQVSIEMPEYQITESENSVGIHNVMDITDGLEDGEGDLEVESTTEESSWDIIQTPVVENNISADESEPSLIEEDKDLEAAPFSKREEEITTLDETPLRESLEADDMRSNEDSKQVIVQLKLVESSSEGEESVDYISEGDLIDMNEESSLTTFIADDDHTTSGLEKKEQLSQTEQITTNSSHAKDYEDNAQGDEILKDDSSQMEQVSMNSNFTDDHDDVSREDETTSKSALTNTTDGNSSLRDLQDNESWGDAVTSQDVPIEDDFKMAEGLAMAAFNAEINRKTAKEKEEQSEQYKAQIQNDMKIVREYAQQRKKLRTTSMSHIETPASELLKKLAEKERKRKFDSIGLVDPRLVEPSKARNVYEPASTRIGDKTDSNKYDDNDDGGDEQHHDDEDDDEDDDDYDFNDEEDAEEETMEHKKTSEKKKRSRAITKLRERKFSTLSLAKRKSVIITAAAFVVSRRLLFYWLGRGIL